MPSPDPDLTTGPDPFVRRQQSRVMREQAPVIAAVAAGGAAGACARYSAELVWPTPAGAFPWTTFMVNLTGCAVMGVVMVAITELWVGHRLLRPLLGTGVLGGYTTFSTFAGEVDTLTANGHPDSALLYVVITPVAVLITTWASATATRHLLTRRTS